MARLPRAGQFLFDVDRFENDPVVLAMQPLSRAFYARLLLRLWKAPEPGVVPDDDRVLRAMCEAGEHWDSIRDDIRSAFDSEHRPGHLIQWGTARTHEAQTSTVARIKDARKAAGRASGRSRKPRNTNDIEQTANKIEQNPTGIGVGVGAFTTPHTPPAGGVRDWFTKCQDAYPRKGGSPADSRTAFDAALDRHPGKIDAEDLANAASSYAARCRADGILPSRCPSLRRWLNRDEFLIEFADKPPPVRPAPLEFGEPADPETVAEAMREIDRTLT